ncbi:Scarecrow-like transcription factor PAT1 [Rhynchospora pubera]|uniref:Scarecrow-like transcription factor PAT1 n=1 Tax=Rhynchospora pubera TaxID=906938 RepID=A0AAV8CY78_9POAL|nr:Scarecrow-like transcription factor PAT1 [Rhynchospora pubera]
MEQGPPWRDPRWTPYNYGAGSTVQLPLQGRSDGGGSTAGGMLKRSFTEMERQNQQALLQQALLWRAVRQKTLMESPLQVQAPVLSPLSPILSPSVFSSGSSDLGSLTSASSFSSLNSIPGLVSQPQQREMILNRNMNMMNRNLNSNMSMSMNMNMNVGMNSNMNLNSNMNMNMSMNRSPAGYSFPTPSPAPVNDSVRNRLQELERQLLCDDEDEEPSVSGSVVINSEWDDETIQQILDISTPSPPPPPPVPQLPMMGTAQIQPLSSSPSNSSSSTASSSASCSPPASATPPRQLLADTASAIAEGNLEMALANMAVLKRNVNPNGDTEQRLTAMMATSLAARINSSSATQLLAGNPIAELCGQEQRFATQLLHDKSPCFKLGLLAANLAILRSTEGSCLHLIDFDIGTGSQHAGLIQALGESRKNVVFKITVVSDPTSPFTPATSAQTKSVVDLLKKVAERAAVDLRFNIVTCRVSELDRVQLGCEPGETLAVNLAFVLSRVPDESVTPANPRDELLRRVRSLGPHVVTLVEQEMNGNTAPFTTRFTEACGHYGAILDSLEVTWSRDSMERARVEAALARKAVNLVSKEGAERVERCEVLGKWRARMSMAGLAPVSLGPDIANQLRARLSSARPNPGFMVKEESGGIGFGWTSRILTVASAWR